ncbi:uncharacterized protein JN550_010082 [Neoarthrinium moseri]|uniref:uncharacterized protein n=1 Tax=Neoarthrinium moseri TaxID=1658444 RepID=UPI001FDBA642|nr:uncharacterized protein JN550_010082 [Neoarthrinium moseri]KAI1862745.1 hypothetical protein JN550_010082 [Neoarthrinium moseri]
MAAGTKPPALFKLRRVHLGNGWAGARIMREVSAPMRFLRALLTPFKAEPAQHARSADPVIVHLHKDSPSSRFSGTSSRLSIPIPELEPSKSPIPNTHNTDERPGAQPNSPRTETALALSSLAALHDGSLDFFHKRDPSTQVPPRTGRGPPPQGASQTARPSLIPAHVNYLYKYGRLADLRGLTHQSRELLLPIAP